jgi:hypothetical protein
MARTKLRHAYAQSNPRAPTCATDFFPMLIYRAGAGPILHVTTLQGPGWLWGGRVFLITDFYTGKERVRGPKIVRCGWRAGS